MNVKEKEKGGRKLEKKYILEEDREGERKGKLTN